VFNIIGIDIDHTTFNAPGLFQKIVVFMHQDVNERRTYTYDQSAFVFYQGLILLVII
jgi:hypothetical protein